MAQGCQGYGLHILHNPKPADQGLPSFALLSEGSTTAPDEGSIHVAEHVNSLQYHNLAAMKPCVLVDVMKDSDICKFLQAEAIAGYHLTSGAVSWATASRAKVRAESSPCRASARRMRQSQATRRSSACHSAWLCWLQRPATLQRHQKALRFVANTGESLQRTSMNLAVLHSHDIPCSKLPK